jgi:hypothetical protein
VGQIAHGSEQNKRIGASVVGWFTDIPQVGHRFLHVLVVEGWMRKRGARFRVFRHALLDEINIERIPG